MRLVAIVLLASTAACFSKPPRPGEDTDAAPGDVLAEGFLAGFSHRKRVTVQANAETSLVNFPVGVAVTDPDIAAIARADGRDIVATAADGTTRLAHELVAYDAGALELWVRLPELATTGAFYLYYGGEPEPPSTAVWDGPVFAGVWHLAGAGTAIDSTTQRNNLDAAGPQLPKPSSGVYGGARELDGDDQLAGGDPGDGSLDFADQSFSYSMWVRQTVIGATGFDTPFYKGGVSPAEPGYCWLLGNTGWTAKLTDNAGHVADPELGAAASFLDQWVHITAVVDRATGAFTTFANGQRKQSQSLITTQVGSVSTTESIELGRGTTEPFRGHLDEIRIYKTALGDAWIATEYRNGTDPDFLTFGVVEVRP